MGNVFSSHLKGEIMKIDLYTKVILTGIFACLCLVLLRDVQFEKRAEAQEESKGPLSVVITGLTDGVGGRLGSLPVTVTGCIDGIGGRTMPLPVNIHGTRGNVPVNIQGTTGNVPVQIQGARGNVPVSVQNWPR